MEASAVLYVALYATGLFGRYHWALVVSPGPLSSERVWILQITNEPAGSQWSCDHLWGSPWSSSRIIGCIRVATASGCCAADVQGSLMDYPPTSYDGKELEGPSYCHMDQLTSCADGAHWTCSHWVVRCLLDLEEGGVITFTHLVTPGHVSSQEKVDKIRQRVTALGMIMNNYNQPFQIMEIGNPAP